MNTASASRVGTRRVIGAAGAFALSCALTVLAAPLDPSGEIDPSYTGDGTAFHNFTTVATTGFGQAILAQGTKVVVAGGSNQGTFRDFAILRLNSDGTPDFSFGDGGVKYANFGGDDTVLALGRDSGGRFVGTGFSSSTGTPRPTFPIAVFTPNGQLDATFNPGAIAPLSPGQLAASPPAAAAGRGEDVIFDRSDRIVVAGWADFAAPPRDAMVGRILANGSPDTSFGGDGWVNITFGRSTRGLGVRVVPGASPALDKLVVVGTVDGAPRTGFIAMLNADGSLDTGFSGDGILETNLGTGDARIRGVEVLSNGQIVVCDAQSGFIVAKFTQTGAAAGGPVTVPGMGAQHGCRRIVRDASDDIHVVGFSQPAGSLDVGYARLSSALAVEVTRTVEVGGESDGYGIDLDASLKPLLAARTVSNTVDLDAVRLNVDGTNDNTFAGDGTYRAALVAGSSDTPTASAVQADGKIVTAGFFLNSTEHDGAVMRINEDGSIDNGFNGDGRFTFDILQSDTAEGVAIVPSGVPTHGNKVMVAGRSSDASSTNYFLYRFNTDGSLDTGFSGDGRADDTLGTNSDAYEVVVQSDGRAIVGGHTNNAGGAFRFRRHNHDGSADAGFNATADIGAADVLKAMAVDPSGNVVAAGNCIVGGVFRFCLARLLGTNGALDASFDTDGKVVVNLPGDDNNDNTAEIRSIYLLPDLDTADANDYKILATGQIVDQTTTGSPPVVRTQSKWGVARFNMNGSLDTSFGGTGVRMFAPGVPVGSPARDPIGAANSVSLQHDEKLVLAGESSTPDPLAPCCYLNRQLALARLNWDGSDDPTFGTANGWTYTTMGTDPSDGLVAHTYLTGALMGRTLVTSQSLQSDFGYARYQADSPAPQVPSTPDLLTADDSGRFSNDNLTNITSPRFTGTCRHGETVQLLVNGTQTFPRSRAICNASGQYTVTLTAQSGNPATLYQISAVASSGIGTSTASSALPVTIDTVAAAPNIINPTAGAAVQIDPVIDGDGVETVAAVVVTTAGPGPGAGCTDPDFATVAGVWSCNSTLRQGQHTIAARQTDLAGNTSSPANRTFRVKVRTSSAITTSVNPSRFGQTVTFTTTVTPLDAAAVSLAGTNIRFVIDGTTAGTVALTSSGVGAVGTATFSPPGLGLAVGIHTVQAVYDENNDWFGSSATLTPPQEVLKADTDTTVTSSVNPSVFGQPVTLTATIVAVSPGAGTPAGTVDFSIDGGAVQTVMLNASGQASITTAALAVGNHSVAATYSGNASYNGSNDTLPGGQTVNEAQTDVAVASSLNPSQRGDNVTFTATVTAQPPGAGTPTGTVDFFVDGSPTPAASPTLTGGIATFSTSTLAAGTHAIVATYRGDDPSFLGDSGTLAGGQLVNRYASTTTVASSVNPSKFGQSVTFTATVDATAPTAPVPTGNVTFVIDGGAPQTVALDAAGQATFTTATLAGGTHTVRVDYAGDADVDTSTGNLTPSQLVEPADTTTTLTSTGSPTVFGQSVTFTATVAVVAPGAGTPTGSVTFTIDGTPQTVTLDATGQATVTTSSLAAGSHAVAASYVASANFAASTATPLTHVVNPAATTTTVTSSANPAAQGASVTFTATIAVTPPGTGTPTGNVTFTIDGTPGAPIPLGAGGTAMFTTSSLTPGTHTVSATFAPTGTSYAGSTGALSPDQEIFPIDFGDAPASYATTVAANGARHRAQGPTLGAAVDSEPDGVPSAAADSDDANASPDDEDGVVFGATIVAGQSADVTVTASVAARLDAWFDFNADGDWNDAGEQIFANAALAAGANALTYAVPAGTAAERATFARFRISSTGGLGTTGFAADGEVEDHRVTTSPMVDLEVVEAESADPVVPGSGAGNLVHTVTVTNQGPSNATGVVLSQAVTFPSGVTLDSATPSAGTYTNGTWTLGALANGANATLILTMTVSAAAPTGADAICGTAAVTAAGEPRIDTADDTDTECTSIQGRADLSVTHTESIDPVVAGSGAGNLVYVVTLANAGPSVATATRVDELLQLPSGVALASSAPSTGTYANGVWTVGTLAVGANATLTLTLTAGASAPTGANTICGTATASSAEVPINPANDSAGVCTSVVRSVDLRVTKTDTPDPVTAGSGSANLTHVVTVRNLGPSDASGVSITETLNLPAGASVAQVTPSAGTYVDPTWSLGTLAANTEATLTVAITVGPSAAHNATVCDTATVAAANEPLANTADDSANTCTTVVRSADVSIAKTDNVDPPPAGSNVIYTLAVTNQGPSDASGVVATDNLPGGVTLVRTTGCAEDAAPGGGIPTCTLGALASGASRNVTVEVSVNPGPPPSITNVASVTRAESDSVAANDTDSETTTFDAVQPTVTALDVAPASADAALTGCESVLSAVSGFSVTFSEPMYDPPGNSTAGDVTNPASYRLVRPAAGMPFSTAACASPAGSDTVVTVAATFDAASRRATLTLPQGQLRDGLHRFVLCNTLRDAAGNPLDSGGSGEVTRTWRVDQSNWLASAHFDTYDAGCAAASRWTSTNAAAVNQSAPGDASGSPLSGAAHNTSSTAGFDLAQCAAVPSGAPSTAYLRAAIRIDAGAATLVGFTPQCAFHGGAACGGALLSEVSFPVLFGATGGYLRIDRAVTVPPGARSALCRFTLTRATGTTFEADLDELFLGAEPALFRDGYEDP